MSTRDVSFGAFGTASPSLRPPVLGGGHGPFGELEEGVRR